MGAQFIIFIPLMCVSLKELTANQDSGKKGKELSLGCKILKILLSQCLDTCTERTKTNSAVLPI